MKNKILTLFILTLFIATWGCSNKKLERDRADKKRIADSREASIPLFMKLYPEFDLQILRDSIKIRTQRDSLLHSFFSKSAFTPLWIKDTLDTGSLKRLSKIFENIDEHGLPKDYFKGWENITSIVDSIYGGAYRKNADSLYLNLAALNETTTRLMLQFVTGMTFGFVNPDSLFFDNYTIKTKRPDSLFYEKVFTDLNTNPLNTIIASQPSEPIYKRMQQEYRLLDSIRHIEFKSIKIKGTNQNYKTGDKSLNISHIANRLMITGEYIPPLDSLNADSLHQVFDDELLEAVNRFRVRMSYPEEKEIGKTAVDALNRPFDYYIDQLRANMERYRWQRVKERHNKHIEVNIASFKLVATEKDSLPLVMNVCVGKPIHKTPMLQSDLSYINLNPKWNIPRSIVKNETLVMQKRDTAYLRKHNMRLYKDNEEVDPASIDWKNVKSSTFGYLIRQDPGDYNSLGRIKFMFSNSFSVYLHDTPSKRFFNYKNRAVSHGCVRVQMPVELAFFCLSPISDEYKDRLRYSMDKTVETKEGRKLLRENKLAKLNDIVTLKNQNISLFLDYHTVYMIPNDDTLYYADDAYGYDSIILDALKGIMPEKPQKKDKGA